ncbi:hypothetical protein CAEBREN_16014 [Caenorhabditis brenneri]|uniref:Uncharacterized protein n=1 Tax=Caenorhabditis brenneri TaxID=135651 RepID=G0PHU9_CAEBE|nr:hypothetical protein CAEBREN_16014 [Caenorhabditis brenneri]
MTEFFSQKQIDEIRECFNFYATSGILKTASQLRCALRSLGYSPTAAKTQEYFRKQNKKPIEFAMFLDICKDEQNSPDPLTEIIKALNPTIQLLIKAPCLKSVLNVHNSVYMRLQDITIFLRHPRSNVSNFRNKSRSMPSRELAAILSQVGERMSPEEIKYLLSKVEVNGMVPHQALIEYISR